MQFLHSHLPSSIIPLFHLSLLPFPIPMQYPFQFPIPPCRPPNSHSHLPSSIDSPLPPCPPPISHSHAIPIPIINNTNSSSSNNRNNNKGVNRMRLKRSGLVTLFIGWMKLFSTVASLIPAR
ncbi:hypothetical protein ES332_D08G160200v1, partial [Gossypium tomentosum]